MEFALEAAGVSKKFNNKTALADISFGIPRGSAFGIIGRNGAGKTTLIKLILGFLRPSCGTLRVIGGAPGEFYSKIGYLPEYPDYHLSFTGREYLKYLAGVSGMNGAAAAAKVSELLEMTGMSDGADRRMAHYSKGMLQKIGIAQALMTSPEFVILDEPFSGLDPFAQKELCDIMAALKAQNKTLLICSHILAHLEKICDGFAIIHRGSIIRHGETSSMLVTRGRYRLSFENAGAALVKELEEKHGLSKADDGAYILEEKKKGDKEAVLKRLIESGAVINALGESKETLDDYFNSVVSPREAE
jgi:ABC-type multidrug transport system ATPase subunit